MVDEHEFLSYKLNPILAELSQKYGATTSSYPVSPRLTMWINEYDGARIQVAYGRADVDPRSVIVSSLYLVRDEYIKHHISFGEMRKTMINLIATTIVRDPTLIEDLDQLLELFNCNLHIAGKNARSWKSTRPINLHIKLSGPRKSIPKQLEITIYSKTTGTVTQETRSLEVKRGSTLAQIPEYSILKLKTEKSTLLLAVGGKDETIEIQVEKNGKLHYKNRKPLTQEELTKIKEKIESKHTLPLPLIIAGILILTILIYILLK